MMVTMEDCEDQIMTNEPTLEQTDVQPHHPGFTQHSPGNATLQVITVLVMLVNL